MILSSIRSNDQSETFFCNYSESGSIFSPGNYNVQKSRTGWVALVEGLTKNVITNCMK